MIHSVIASAAKQSILPLCGGMDCFAALAMTERHAFAVSRHDAPEVCKYFRDLSPIRGRRECRMRAAPEVPCAMGRRVRARAYRAAEAIRHSLRNGFTAYNVLSPENGSFASVGTQGMKPRAT